MRDPYETLASQLAAAAERQEAGAPERRRRWLSNRLHALSVAAALVLGGGAVALAATGVLSGSAVKPEVPLNAAAGNGLPLTGASAHLALLAADPGGGLPWGMRIEDTTQASSACRSAVSTALSSASLGSTAPSATTGASTRCQRPCCRPATAARPARSNATPTGRR